MSDELYADIEGEMDALGERIDDLVADFKQAKGLLYGLVGLIELIQGREFNGQDSAALLTNHRYVDACAWLEAHDHKVVSR